MKPGSKKSVWMIGLSDQRRGGVASVLRTYRQASWFRAPDFALIATCLPGNSWVRWMSAVRQFLGFAHRLSQQPPALLHIHLSSGASFWRKTPYLLTGHLHGIRLLINVHPSHFYDDYLAQRRPVRWLIRRFLRLADAVGFANPEMIPLFVDLLPGKRLCYLPNPIDLHRFRPGSKPQQKQSPYALFLGAFFPQKGIAEILTAAPAVLQAFPDFRFVLCGDGKSEGWKEQVDQSWRQHIDFRSWVDGDEKLELLQNATALLLPSYSEGFPMIVSEAMACGVPVICSAVGGLVALLRNRHDALLIPPKDARQLQEALLHLLGDARLRADLRRYSLQSVKRFDVEGLLPYLQSLYTSLICSGGKTSSGFQPRPKSN
ncbi:MAG TPA: glycosyltransferase family 4 protein [bacterium]|nr:glycosyltransferase family 4 protein [bacterium]HNT65180.1 glycosyltransferase family 4 protein [bacterium]